LFLTSQKLVCLSCLR